MRVAIDPAFLALHESTSAARLRGHVEGIQQWSSGVRDGDVDAVLSGDIYEVLADLDLFPLRERLQPVLDEHGVDEVAAFDVARMILDLIERSSAFDEFVVIVEESNDAPPPPGIAGGCSCHAVLDQVLHQTWRSSAAMTQCRGQCAPIVLATSRECSEGQMIGEFSFREVLLASEEIVTDASGTFSLATCQSMDAVYARVDPLELARQRIDDDRPWEYAIRSAAKQWLGSEIELSELAFGEEWASDMGSPMVLNNDGVLKRALTAAAEAILGSAPAKTHALRTGPGPNEKQVADGKWHAWRHDIDREYHLHYWRGPNGDVELGSVRVHNVFSIPARSK